MTQRSLASHIEVPAREARAVPVEAGAVVRVVDTYGGQVGDLFAFVRDDPAECLSAAHTRASTNRLFPELGEQLVSNRRRALLTLVEDTSPGRHDMLIPACDPERYRALGAPGWHASCAENLRTAASAAGIDVAVIPQPVNVFMDIPVTTEGELVWNPAPTAPGDSVAFRAERDCLVVVSACPQDLVGINGGRPKPLAIEIEPGPAW